MKRTSQLLVLLELANLLLKVSSDWLKRYITKYIGSNTRNTADILTQLTTERLNSLLIYIRIFSDSSDIRRRISECPALRFWD